MLNIKLLKKNCKKLQVLIINKHIYVNNELLFKFCKNKLKNAKFSLHFSKNVNQLNEILFIFELNANVYFFVQTNILSIIINIFKIAANYIYDSRKKISIFLNKSLKSKKIKFKNR